MSPFSVSRTIDAPPDKVFGAWLDEGSIRDWYAPTYEYDVEVERLEAVEGGEYVIRMTHVLGRAHTMKGTYTKISAPNELVFSMEWADDESEAPLIVVTCEAADGGTLISLSLDRIRPEEAAMHLDGWEGCLWNLANSFHPQAGHSQAVLLALHRRLFANVLEGMEGHLQRREGEAANHPLWIAAHLASSRAGLAGALGEPVEHPLSAFDGAVDDDVELPSIEVVKKVFADASHAAYRGLRKATDASLARPAPVRVPMKDPSLRAFLDFLVSHEAYHIGQLGVLRRIFGLPAMSYAPPTSGDD